MYAKMYPMMQKGGVKVRFLKSGSMSDIRVLLIDMDNDTIAALTLLLSEIPSSRLEVQTSVEDAADIIPKFQPNVILYSHEEESDGVSHVEGFRELVSDPYVIVLLAEFDPALVKIYTAAGARDFISRDHKYFSSLRRGVRRALLRVLGRGKAIHVPSSLPGVLGSPQVGDTVLHYRIIEELGEGGVSETFLVEDLNAGHPAVIKILSTRFRKDVRDQQRIIQQIKEATKVHHADLVSIRSVEESRDRIIIVMEYAEGESLKSMMQKGPLGIRRVLAIGIQIAGALSAIHEEGQVHGNIRPSSIIISPYGRARLTDFGVARKIPDLTALKIDRRYMKRLWQMGILRESASYMSPEQLSGNKMDERSDIFSLGCVLYHAVTGVSPFDGISVPLVVHRILRVSPAPPSEIIPHLPEELDQLLALTLAKDREERIRSAQELSDALHLLATSKAQLNQDVIRARLNSLTERIYVEQQQKAKERRIRDFVMAGLSLMLVALAVVLYFIAFYDDGTRSIAVIPFQVDTAGLPQEAVAVEITESLMEQLSTVPALKVIQSGSAFPLRERDLKIDEIATLLNVRNVMTGRLMRQKDGWMLATGLYTHSGKLLGETYRKTTLENSVHSVADIVPVTLVRIDLAGDAQSLHPPGWRSRDAYAAYWNGRSRYHKKTVKDIEASVASFEKAISLEPGNALPYAGMAESLLWMASHSQDPSFWYSQACEAARAALDLNQKSYQAHAVLGAVYLLDNLDLIRAEKELRTSLNLNPSHVPALSYLAVVLTATGRTEEALQRIQVAGALDPISQETQNRSAWLLVQLRLFDHAIRQSQECMEIGSDSVFVHNVLGDAYLGKGWNEQAQIAYRYTQDLLSPNSEVKIATVMASSNMRPEAMQLLENLEAKPTGKLTPEFMAAAYARLGMNDAAFRWLEKAMQDRTPGVLMLKVSYQFDPLRADSRMDSLIRRLGIE